MYIGEKWISTDVNHNLVSKDFYNSKDYQRLFKICTERIALWMENNKDLIATLKKIYCASYGARQVAYAASGISTYIGKIQTLGRHAYKDALHQQVVEALDEEYAKLPDFAQQAYSIAEYSWKIVDAFMAENKNGINREISARAYSEMRRILDSALW